MNPVPAGTIWTMFGCLVVVYAVIAFFFLTLLLWLRARWQREDEGRGPELAPEVGSPYGPRPPVFPEPPPWADAT